MTGQVEITDLLQGIRRGDPDAENQLISVVYTDLRKMARRYMAGERRNHTLQPTALIHEVYLRVFRGAPVDWKDRAHFLAVAASQMKRVLIDHGRAFRGPNRGGDFKVVLDETLVANPKAPCDIEVLNDLLDRLRKAEPVAAQVIELKFFGGLTDAEVAQELGTSHSSVRRHWVFARAWMGRHLAASKN
jgi:RNA polymerase sigma-70 factor (ECF subfamily)